MLTVHSARAFRWKWQQYVLEQVFWKKFTILRWILWLWYSDTNLQLHRQNFYSWLKLWIWNFFKNIKNHYSWNLPDYWYPYHSISTFDTQKKKAFYERFFNCLEKVGFLINTAVFLGIFWIYLILQKKILDFWPRPSGKKVTKNPMISFLLRFVGFVYNRETDFKDKMAMKVNFLTMQWWCYHHSV